ncbi:thiamine biosynthesis protein ThiF [Clostridium cochlearium]|uniref:Sulfur carrier protein ThiS adenylyltransferase n=1 Tax=Clostridium cochlearium TaxID=1494 RepID=A0ABY0QPC7_CLOCO|nr:thiamine biosynthesis protein ThiF [Clostridium cochlearium]MBV1818867.1 thiamine biosynthesis protein ThiF [Bacteroidales bacterium MSK.15.36]NSJ91544.1 thiamine biosynthesis protein ThiF [Coprococcus sp. MSK.21.13]MCG4571586.1 thiamine biosynthesis protein ThiF [Clostridium cochlearium]MCG4580819.1 thiamine biosynthesis protein ThiF [Clostridium cochlearium]SDL43247.1 sulfur carrier protein ThiS adenylyltransferase [Clostridium cochlearium]
MKVYVNEILLNVDEDADILELKNKIKKEADVVIYNGFPVKDNIKLKPLDRIVFIKKGEIPTKEEMEAQLVARHTPKIYEKLKKVSVAIAGLGGLGSTAALSLARVGIGKLILVDYDVVEPSNLNRQQYFIKHIGMKKTQAMKDIISQCNPFVKIETIDAYVDEKNIESIFKDADIIIEAFDNAETKALITNKVLTTMKNKKIITASGLAGYEDCNLIRSKKINDKFYIVGDGQAEAKPGRGLMAPRVSVAANHQANLVLEIILNN